MKLGVLIYGSKKIVAAVLYKDVVGANGDAMATTFLAKQMEKFAEDGKEFPPEYWKCVTVHCVERLSNSSGLDIHDVNYADEVLPHVAFRTADGGVIAGISPDTIGRICKRADVLSSISVSDRTFSLGAWHEIHEDGLDLSELSEGPDVDTDHPWSDAYSVLADLCMADDRFRCGNHVFEKMQ